MQLRQLEIFLAVARHGSFSKAAEAMYLAQPTVSAHVRALEEELGARLFVRSTKQLSLTPQGQLFFSYAAQIVNFSHRAQEALRNIAQEQQNRLTLAASTVPSQYLLPAVLPQVRARFPKLRLRVSQGDSAHAIQCVLTGEAELGIVGDRVDKPNLVYHPLMEERLVVAAPNTPYFETMRGRLTPDVFENYPFILREPGSGTRKSMEEFLKSLGVRSEGMQIAAELESTEGVLRSVEHGLGISIVSELAARYFRDSGRILFFEADSPFMRRAFYMALREDVPLSPAARYLMQLLRELA